MGEYESPFTELRPEDVQGDNLFKLNQTLRRLHEQVAELSGAGGNPRIVSPLSAPSFTADSTEIPTSDKTLLTYGAAKELFSPNSISQALVSRKWQGQPVNPIPIGGVQDPNAPGVVPSVSLEVVLDGDNYGFHLTWTAPEPIGSVTAYEPQVHYYGSLTDGVPGDPLGDWMGLGGTVPVGENDHQWGFWPLAGAIRYVVARIRSINSNGLASVWTVGTDVGTLPASSIGAAGPPGLPDSASVSASQPDDNSTFTLSVSWPSNDANAENVVFYDVEMRHFTDEACTTPVSGNMGQWISIGSVPADPNCGTTQTAIRGPFSSQLYTDVYCKVRVGTRNRDGVFVSVDGARVYRESSSAALIEGWLFSGIIPPALEPNLPDSAGLTVYQPDDCSSYTLEVSWSSATTDVSMVTVFDVEVRYYSDPEMTTPTGEWINIGSEPNTGSDQSVRWGPFPTQTQAQGFQYVNARVGTRNKDGVISNSSGDRIYRYVSGGPAQIIPNQYVDPSTPPVVESLSMSVLLDGSNFGFLFSWVPPDPLGTTVAFEPQVRYYAELVDGLPSNPLADWMGLGGTVPQEETSHRWGYWPPAATQRYVKARIRSLSAGGAASQWTESFDIGTIPAAPEVPGVVPPPLPDAITIEEVVPRSVNPTTYAEEVVLRINFTFPAGFTTAGNHFKAWLSRDGGTTWTDYLGEYGCSASHDLPLAAPPADESWRVKVTTGNYVSDNPLDDAVLSNVLSVPALGNSSATAAVLQDISGIYYDTDSKGNKTWGMSVAWLNPTARPNFKQTTLKVTRCNGSGTQAPGSTVSLFIFTGSGLKAAQFEGWGIPTDGYNYYRLQLVYVNTDNSETVASIWGTGGVIAGEVFTQGSYIEVRPGTNSTTPVPRTAYPGQRIRPGAGIGLGYGQGGEAAVLLGQGLQISVNGVTLRLGQGMTFDGANALILDSAYIKNLAAQQISATTLYVADIEGLTGSDGKIDPVLIPNISTSKITGLLGSDGKIQPVLIPNISTSQVTGLLGSDGKLQPVLIPDIALSKITAWRGTITVEGSLAFSITQSGTVWGSVTFGTDGITLVRGGGITSIGYGSITANSADIYALRMNGLLVATQSWVTSQGFVTSSALSGYATQSWVSSQGYVTSSHTHSISQVNGLQTALDGKASQSSVTSISNEIHTNGGTWGIIHYKDWNGANAGAWVWRVGSD